METFIKMSNKIIHSFYHDTKKQFRENIKENVMNEPIINDVKVDLSHATSDYEPHKMDGLEYG